MEELGFVMICLWLACGLVQGLSGLQMDQMTSTWSPLQNWSWPSCPSCRNSVVLYIAAVQHIDFTGLADADCSGQGILMPYYLLLLFDNVAI